MIKSYFTESRKGDTESRKEFRLKAIFYPSDIILVGKRSGKYCRIFVRKI